MSCQPFTLNMFTTKIIFLLKPFSPPVIIYLVAPCRQFPLKYLLYLSPFYQCPLPPTWIIVLISSCQAYWSSLPAPTGLVFINTAFFVILKLDPDPPYFNTFWLPGLSRVGFVFPASLPLWTAMSTWSGCHLPNHVIPCVNHTSFIDFLQPPQDLLSHFPEAFIWLLLSYFC